MNTSRSNNTYRALIRSTNHKSEIKYQQITNHPPPFLLLDLAKGERLRPTAAPPPCHAASAEEALSTGRPSSAGSGEGSAPAQLLTALGDLARRCGGGVVGAALPPAGSGGKGASGATLLRYACCGGAPRWPRSSAASSLRGEGRLGDRRSSDPATAVDRRMLQRRAPRRRRSSARERRKRREGEEKRRKCGREARIKRMTREGALLLSASISDEAREQRLGVSAHVSVFKRCRFFLKPNPFNLL